MGSRFRVLGFSVLGFQPLNPKPQTVSFSFNKTLFTSRSWLPGLAILSLVPLQKLKLQRILKGYNGL